MRQRIEAKNRAMENHGHHGHHAAQQLLVGLWKPQRTWVFLRTWSVPDPSVIARRVTCSPAFLLQNRSPPEPAGGAVVTQCRRGHRGCAASSKKTGCFLEMLPVCGIIIPMSDMPSAF